jgi:hypothetical protein
MNQVDWVSEAPARLPAHQRHSTTSRAAARAAVPRVNELQARVLAFIRAQGGATDNEIQDALDMNPSTQRPRRIELMERGLVRDSGRKRKTPSGREAVVWECYK